MNEKELMIGDWVKATYTTIDDNDNEHKCFTYAQVDSIGNDGTFIGVEKCFSVKVTDDIDTDSLEEAYPIPLTTEILRKNDFYYSDEEEDWVSIDDNLNLNLCELKGGSWYINIYIEDTVELTFKYVHELQHLLRLIGLSDLADNFKV